VHQGQKELPHGFQDVIVSISTGSQVALSTGEQHLYFRPLIFSVMSLKLVKNDFQLS